MIEYKVSDMTEIINRVSPESMQEEWDNTGNQILFSDVKVNCVLTCLDVTEQVAKEALNLGAKLIVSHHPIIFGGITSITDKDFKGRLIQFLIKNEISVYSSHTAFDKAERGNNRKLADMLGLENVCVPPGTDICLMGDIPKDAPERLEDFAKYVSDKLGHVDLVRFAGKEDMVISKVGICTGSGSEFAGLLKGVGCQAMVTGDLKYHQALDAFADDFGIIDAGHYGTEIFFSENMKDILENALGDAVSVIASGVEKCPFKMV